MTNEYYVLVVSNNSDSTIEVEIYTNLADAMAALLQQSLDEVNEMFVEKMGGKQVYEVAKDGMSAIVSIGSDDTYYRILRRESQ